MRIPKSVLVVLGIGAVLLFIYAIRDQPTRTVTKTHTVTKSVVVPQVHKVRVPVPAPMPAACKAVITETGQIATLEGNIEADATRIQDQFAIYQTDLAGNQSLEANKAAKAIVAIHEQLGNYLVDVNEIGTQLKIDRSNCHS